MLEGLAAMGEFALLLQPDHATPCNIKTHSNDPVPFAILKSPVMRARPGLTRRYTEAEAAHTGIFFAHGYRLIEALINGEMNPQ